MTRRAWQFLSWLVAAQIAAAPTLATVWVAPIADDRTGQQDDALAEPFRQAVLLFAGNDWRFGPAPTPCSGDCRSIVIVGHRAATAHYALTLQGAGTHTAHAIAVDADADISPFDLAQALVLNCLFLLGNVPHLEALRGLPAPPQSAPRVVPAGPPLRWHVGVGPTWTAGLDRSALLTGTEMLLQWHAQHHIDVQLIGGFGGLGHGENARGRYHYHETSLALAVGPTWERANWRLGIALGGRAVSEEFEFSTRDLGEVTDTVFAAVGDVRLQRRIRERLLIGLAVRPTVSQRSTRIGQQDAQLFEPPLFAIQAAFTLGLEL